MIENNVKWKWKLFFVQHLFMKWKSGDTAKTSTSFKQKGPECWFQIKVTKFQEIWLNYDRVRKQNMQEGKAYINDVIMITFNNHKTEQNFADFSRKMNAQ